MSATYDGQRRAKIGGERGPNGEWYEGGKFIATTDRPKVAPPAPRVLTPEEIAARAARDEEDRILAARFQTWLVARRAKFADLIADLTRNPGHPAELWAELVKNQSAGFLWSLGTQLERTGTLSPKQARYAVKHAFGRCTKKNGVAWGELLDALTEELQ